MDNSDLNLNFPVVFPDSPLKKIIGFCMQVHNPNYIREAWGSITMAAGQSFFHDPILSKLSDTVFILGRTSGSLSVQASATWNTASTSFLACTSCNRAGSTKSDNGFASSNPFLTHLTKSGISKEVDVFGESSGDFPVSNSRTMTPKEYTSHFWVGRPPGARASGAQ